MGDVVYFNFAKEGKFMASVYDVARFFLSKESMDHLKLQKLCYYAQAWNCALKNEPLMNTRFEAWVHGPVSNQLYQQYKQWGWYFIPQYTGKNETLTISEQEFLDKIYSLYGKYSGDQLEELTHSESPWLNARKGYDKYASCNVVISENDMKNYYNGILRG